MAMDFDRREIYDAWADPESVWSAWAKPVLFATMPAYSYAQLEHARSEDAAVSVLAEDVARLAGSGDGADGNVPEAWVLDLPGAASVVTARAMAKRGFDPVPVFNGVPGPGAVGGAGQAGIVDPRPIALRLAAYASDVAANRESGAWGIDRAPVFMLDAGRMPKGRIARPGYFDNRWLVFPQDFPSARHLLERRIGRVVVAHAGAWSPADDLCHVLRRWQDAGVTIESVEFGAGRLEREAVKVRLPSRFRRAWYRMLAMGGLRKNAAGGFGAVVPQPSSGGGYG